jgi:DNA-binding response OmpR family regulator
MPPTSAVLAHKDPAVLQSLAQASHKHSVNCATAGSTRELRESLAHSRAPLVIVDLEIVGFAELGELCREFPATAFVSTHRLADDVMWTQSLAAGAVDCCVTADLLHVLEASERYIAIKATHSASAA